MVMKMVLAESCGRPHNLVPFVAATEDKKIFAPSSSQYSSFQSLPLAFSPAWGEGVASCYWQSQNHPRLVTSIVLLWASILQPASVISILKQFSAFSIVLLCYIQRYNFLNCQNPRLFGIFRELWTESGSRSGWCKMLREGCEDKKLLLETEFTDCYSAVVSSRLRIKEIQLQQFVVTFLLYWVKPWKILTHACLLCLFHAYFPPWTLPVNYSIGKVWSKEEHPNKTESYLLFTYNLHFISRSASSISNSFNTSEVTKQRTI